jgi:hypothetical protein
MNIFILTCCNTFEGRMTGAFAYWLGISDQGHRDIFTNLDGSSFNYTNWRQGTVPEPYGGWETETSVMSNLDRKWVNQPISSAFSFHYVCKQYVGK